MKITVIDQSTDNGTYGFSPIFGVIDFGVDLSKIPF
jgi:hypothetical protein